jgi:N utilization substance protein B
VLLLATYELLYRPELPFQIILNEAVEVDKILGSNDGHKMVNGVMNSVAGLIRIKK